MTVEAPMETKLTPGEINERLDSFKREHELLVDRLDRELKNLRDVFEITRGESKERFVAFLESHVRSHEREHEQEARASSLAMANLDRRLEGMNEFRAQINATESNYATKDELKSHVVSNDHRMSLIEDRLRAGELKYSTKEDVVNHAAANATRIGVVEDRLRVDESNAVKDRETSLDKNSADVRFRAIERLVWMASGAMTVIMILVQVFRK